MKEFRTFTHAIPLKDKTVALFCEDGFANTVEDKIAMAKSYDGHGDLYVAWPGAMETHVFQATPDQILEALVPKPKIDVGSLVRMKRAYSRATAGLIGVVRVVSDGDVGVELAGFTSGHDLSRKLPVGSTKGYWVPIDCVEAA